MARNIQISISLLSQKSYDCSQLTLVAENYSLSCPPVGIRQKQIFRRLAFLWTTGPEKRLVFLSDLKAWRSILWLYQNLFFLYFSVFAMWVLLGFPSTSCCWLRTLSVGILGRLKNHIGLWINHIGSCIFLASALEKNLLYRARI